MGANLQRLHDSAVCDPGRTVFVRRSIATELWERYKSEPWQAPRSNEGIFQSLKPEASQWFFQSEVEFLSTNVLKDYELNAFELFRFN